MTKNTSLFMFGAIATVMLVSLVGTEQAFAHGGKVFTLQLPNGESRAITVIMGHSNEPTFAQAPGKHDGKHNMELFISDSATGLNLDTADLKVDKFYYKNERHFQKDARDGSLEPLVEDVTIGAVHGDPGHYYARQVLAEPGFYGYHLTGTVDYFGVADVSIDLMAMCRDAPSDFNTPGWFGGYGCTTDIDDTTFPSRGGHHSNQYDKDELKDKIKDRLEDLKDKIKDKHDDDD